MNVTTNLNAIPSGMKQKQATTIQTTKCPCHNSSNCSFKGASEQNQPASTPTPSPPRVLNTPVSSSLTSKNQDQTVSFGIVDIIAFGAFFALIAAIYKSTQKSSKAAKKVLARFTPEPRDIRDITQIY